RPRARRPIHRAAVRVAAGLGRGADGAVRAPGDRGGARLSGRIDRTGAGRRPSADCARAPARADRHAPPAGRLRRVSVGAPPLGPAPRPPRPPPGPPPPRGPPPPPPP